MKYQSAVQHLEVHILLIWKTGNGKSALSNVITGTICLKKKGVIVRINLLKEGIDLPEVSLVCILAG